MLLREGYIVTHKGKEACVKKIHYRDGLIEIAYLKTEERTVAPLADVDYVRQKNRKR